MRISGSNRFSGAFTLVEVMTATMIVALLSFTLYRFLVSQLNGIRLSQNVVEERDSLHAVVGFLQSQLGELPPRGQNELLGVANQFHGQPSDEITWICWGGEGVLTAAAPGNYRVTLAVQPVSDTSTELELGLRRQRLNGTEQRDINFYSKGTAGQKYNWLSIMRPMQAMEIRYFDRRLNVWVDRWNDPKTYPPLVRVRLWKRAGDPPMEAVITLPAANVR
jgi:hypothetical protein